MFTVILMHHDTLLRLCSHNLEDFLFVITLAEFGHNFFINFDDPILNLYFILSFDLLPHEISEIFILWVINDFFPVASPDRESFEELFNLVHEECFFVVGYVINSNNTSFLKPDNIFGVSRYLKTNIDLTFLNEEYLIYLLNYSVDDRSS